MNRIDREATSLGRCLGENIYLHSIRCVLPLVGFSFYIIKSYKHVCLWRNGKKKQFPFDEITP
jgi:hypothetical protein